MPRQKRRLLAVDCETDPATYGRVPKPFLWGAYDGISYWEFSSTDTFADWLKEQYCTAYAHNGGKFDFMYLLKYIEQARAQIIHGRIVKMNFGKAELRDSYASFPTKLGTLGVKLDIDYDKMEAKHRAKHMPEIQRYLKQDCVGLYEAMSEYRKVAGNRTTLAANAYHFAKSLGINPGKTNHTYDRQMRQYYYGGRCEVFQPGTHHNLRVLDLNSAYPYAMQHDHCTGAEHRHISDTEFAALSVEQQQRCFLTIECYSHGAFPQRTDIELTFPHKHDIYYITGWEYLAALQLGLIEAVTLQDIIYHPETINFSSYVQHWYDYKNKHSALDANGERLHPIQYEIGKRMMTNLYGKMAQDIGNYHDYKILPGGTLCCRDYDPDPVGACANCGAKDHEHGWEIYTEYDNVEIHRRPALWKYEFKYGTAWRGQLLYHNVATGASITGFTRAHLLRAIHAIGAEHVYYSDTDSIICDATAPLKNLHLSDRLGDWKDEGTASIGHFAGKKIYGLTMHKRDREGRIKFKIASKGSKLTFDEIERLMRGEIVQWQNNFPSFSIAGEPSFVVRNIRQTAKQSRIAVSHIGV